MMDRWRRREITKLDLIEQSISLNLLNTDLAHGSEP